MSLLEQFQRVTKAIRCPICRHVDWCLVERDNPTDPARAICSRIESQKKWGGAGWLHVLREADRRSYGRSQS